MVRKHIYLSSLELKDSDYKSQLIEYAQKNKKEVLFSSHEEHDLSGKVLAFQATVQVDQIECGSGSGDSKKEAEQQAARVALKGISH
jgi:ribonuclease-3